MQTEPLAHYFSVHTRDLHPCRNLAGIVFLSLFLLPGFLMAQGGGEQGSNHSESEGGERRANRRQRPQAGGVFRRLRELPPAEQRRVMADNPQFQNLPPGRQELIRERLQQWNSMTPQEKERVREREEILDGLSPAQRQEARNIFPQWRELAPPRRQALMVAFRHLRDIPPEQRRPFLDGQRVQEQFSPHERDILEGLNKLLPESRAGSPNDPEQ